MSTMPFGQYVWLYTLHQVEHPADILSLRLRVVVLRYSFAPLDRQAIDAAYADDPRAGAIVVREVVLPRLLTLLDSREPLRELDLIAGQDALWQRYAALRGLPADPVRVPVIHPPHRIWIPARSTTAARLAQLQHTLEMIQIAAETAAALASVWQNWQIGREQRKLLQAQRLMLHEGIQAQLASQEDALQRGLDRSFVRGYLAAHGADPAASLLVSPDQDSPD